MLGTEERYAIAWGSVISVRVIMKFYPSESDVNGENWKNCSID